MKTITLAPRLRHVEASPTLALAAKAKTLAKAGKPVLDFTAGEPDFPTPEPIKQAGIAAIQKNRTKYTPVAGTPELRAAVADSVNRSCGSRYTASHVLVSCGAKHSLYNVFQALCSPGDEVIIFSPYWVSYPPLVHLAGAKPVILETREQEGFLPDPAAIQKAVTSATKAIVLNSPSNPTGAVIDEARLKSIAAIAKQNNLIIVSDEIYDQLVYAPSRHVSIVQADPAIIDQTVLVAGVSKTYSMTGWRIGYALGPQDWIEAMTNVQSHSTSNPASISQDAALAALTGDQQPVAAMREAFAQRRNRLVEGLNKLPGLRCSLPGGAFYAWCNVSALKKPASIIAEKWIDEAMVVTVPGEGFGSPDYVRFSFATSLEAIEEGLKRLSAWLSKKG